MQTISERSPLAPSRPDQPRAVQSRAWWRLLACASLFALVSCGSSDASLQVATERALADAADSMGVRPTAVRTIPTRNPADLTENSALVSSPSEPGTLFTINDSGNEPMLFALDTTGAFRGRWRVAGASNRDWEAASGGPCISGSGPYSIRAGASCLFIGDIGDNEAQRSVLTVYQIDEPRVSDTAHTDELPAQMLRFRYPDQAQDAEALYVGPQGTMFLITKRKRRNSKGKLRPARVFAIAADAWRQRGTVVATLIDSLPIVPGSSFGREISDAALSRDARYLAVRTYLQIFTFATDSTTGRVRSDIRPTICNIYRIEGEPGEGVTWSDNGRDLLLSSEARDAPLVRLTCPLPVR